MTAAFNCPGIVPFNKNALSALLPAPSPSQSSDATTSGKVNSQAGDCCIHCGPSKENPRVKMGLVAPELANILIQPPVPIMKRPARKHIQRLGPFCQKSQLEKSKNLFLM